MNFFKKDSFLCENVKRFDTQPKKENFFDLNFMFLHFVKIDLPKTQQTIYLLFN